MALRMVSSFRATAMSATIFGLPAATRRSKKAFNTGLHFLATMAPMNRTARPAVRPPPMKLLPRPFAGLARERRQPCKGCNLLVAELPELGQLSHKRTRDDGADAGNGGEQFFLGPPGRGAFDGVVDIGIQACQLFFESFDEPGNTLPEARSSQPLLA